MVAHLHAKRIYLGAIGPVFHGPPELLAIKAEDGNHEREVGIDRPVVVLVVFRSDRLHPIEIFS